MPSARRIAGRHPLFPGCSPGGSRGGPHPGDPYGGAAVDVGFDSEAEAEAARARWVPEVDRLAAAFGLGPAVAVTSHGHLSLGLPAPPDLRDLACDVLDRAIGEPGDDPVLVPNLALRAVYDAAHAAALPVFHEGDEVVIGLGAGARRIAIADLPAPGRAADVVREGIVGPHGVPRSIPIVRVTGTNGKTTTANLLGAIAAAAGYVPGVGTSTGVRVGRELVEDGDWSGPGAARIVARDPRVTFAVLETARGGLLRRGLLIDHADVVVLTNVSADHLGEWGIHTVDALARAKLVVAEGLRHRGTLVTHAEDPLLTSVVERWIDQVRPDVRWLRFASHRQSDGYADDTALHLPGDTPGAELVVPLVEIPLTLGGAARYNAENALAAGLAAHALGVPSDAIARGLRSLRPDPGDNPGRSNLFTLGPLGASSVAEARILVDYAHNPDGFSRLAELAVALKPERVLVLFGQAGDRPDALVTALGHAAARFGAALYVLKPLPGYARGRDPSEVVEVLRAALLACGVSPDAIATADDELDGVRRVLAALRPGDLALMLVHEDLDAAVAELTRAGAQPAT